ncbi:hypothetical protein G7046_g3929 [Stylonectria norvegica]|nr:hypothetical protein G7046_g3929 [Stylonectria norvegica]
MPRPKVPNSERKRAAEACNFCRTSKKRCSATVPCTACQRRGIGSSCFLTYMPRGSRAAVAPGIASGSLSAPSPGPSPPQNTIGTRAVPAEQDGLSPAPMLAIQPRRASRRVAARDGDDYRPISPSESRSGPPEEPRRRARQASRSPPLRQESHSRMLLNLRGERVYIGGAAAISFLQFVRDIVADQIGPSQFSHNDKNDNMLEIEPTGPESTTISPLDSDLNGEQKLQYVQTFHTAAAGILELFQPSDIEEFLNPSNEAPEVSPLGRATLDLMIAIGAQSTSAASAYQIGRVYFRRAQKEAFGGMLEDPTTDLVRVFLLMAFYMLGACRRNAAFMYLGVAARAAVALGMHSRDSYTDVNNPKVQLRLRTWVSLCTLDLLVSSILGRPPATTALRFNFKSGNLDLNLAFTGTGTSLLSSYKILLLINDIVDEIYGKKEASTARIEQLLNTLESWRRELPDSLKSPAGLSSESLPDKGITSNIHVSCLYYFAVTLVTRPILISTLTSRLALGTPLSSQLASACVDAAVYLVQTCVDAHKAGLLLGNMCILKAMIFAAGLILGFVMFAERELDYEVETAFRGARDVLEFIAIQSPQAAHYSEILTLLSNAISKRRDKLTLRGRSKFVGRIFSFAEAGSATQDTTPNTVNSQSVGADAHDEVLDDFHGNWPMGQATPDMPGDMDVDLLSGWDSLDLSQWENFPFLSPRSFQVE